MPPGGGGSSTQTVQNFSPEEAAARAAVQSEAARIYGATSGAITGAPYPGSVPVGASPATTAAQRYAVDQAGWMAGTGTQQLQRAQQFGMFDVLNPESNPALQASIQSAIRPVTQAYLDPGGVLAQIRSDSGAAGQYGGSRMGLAEGVAAGRYADTIGDIATNRTNEAYNKGLDVFSRTLALTPSTYGAMMTPANVVSGVGAQQEGYAQNQADYEAQARQWGLNAPWAALQNYANIVYGGSAPGTTTTGTTAQPNRVVSALGGAMTGYAAAGALTTAGFAVNPLIGAGIGLMMGLFS